MKTRGVYALLSLFCLLTCWLIVKFLNDNLFIRGFTGDVIIIFMVYFLIKIFRDYPAMNLALFTLTLAFATEGLQYLKLAAALGLEHNTAFKLILGSVFDPYDLIAYCVGAIGVYFLDTTLIQRMLGQPNVTSDQKGFTHQTK